MRSMGLEMPMLNILKQKTNIFLNHIVAVEDLIVDIPHSEVVGIRRFAASSSLNGK
jgi:hypothetical protein